MVNPFNPNQPKAVEEVEEQFERIGGVFDCQYCDEKVRGASHNVAESLLTWICSSGHRSKIKGFL